MAGWCGGPTARHPSCPHCLRACCASRRAKRQRLERSAGPNPGGPDKSLKLLGRGARSAYAFAVSAISGIPPAPAEKSMKSNRSKQRERRFGSLFPLFPSVHSFDPQKILSPCINRSRLHPTRPLRYAEHRGFCGPVAGCRKGSWPCLGGDLASKALWSVVIWGYGHRGSNGRHHRPAPKAVAGELCRGR